MKQILITGATGNMGNEVIHYLCELGKKNKIIAAVRNIEIAKAKFPNYADLTFREFNFEDKNSFHSAFKNIDILFLLRPPQISQVNEFFKPLLESAKENGIDKIVFLSVQGAEKSKVIPHNKIERLIELYGFRYIFVRPSYFMQNLTTTLLPEIVKNRTITLPSGQAKFNWIDVKNIGEASAILINDFEKYQNQVFEVTGTENKNFYEVADLMSQLTEVDIKFKSINPIRFYFKKKKEGMQGDFAIVMALLHFLPRIQKEPEIIDNYEKLTGKTPTTLSEFLKRENEKIARPNKT